MDLIEDPLSVEFPVLKSILLLFFPNFRMIRLIESQFRELMDGPMLLIPSIYGILYTPFSLSIYIYSIILFS